MSEQEQGNDSAFAALLKSVFCPICGGKLSIDLKDGRKKLVCAKHGEMNAYLNKDPLRAPITRIHASSTNTALETSEASIGGA